MLPECILFTLPMFLSSSFVNCNNPLKHDIIFYTFLILILIQLSKFKVLDYTAKFRLFLLNITYSTVVLNTFFIRHYSFRNKFLNFQILT